jgi:hypothetical protein
MANNFYLLLPSAKRLKKRWKITFLDVKKGFKGLSLQQFSFCTFLKPKKP